MTAFMVFIQSHFEERINRNRNPKETLAKKMLCIFGYFEYVYENEKKEYLFFFVKKSQ